MIEDPFFSTPHRLTETERKVIAAAKAWALVWASEMDDLIEYIPECRAFRDAVEALIAAERNDPYSGMQVREASPEQIEQHEAAVRQAFADAEKEGE